MRLDFASSLDSTDRGLADTGRLGHRSCRPMSGVRWSRRQRKPENLLDLLGGMMPQPPTAATADAVMATADEVAPGPFQQSMYLVMGAMARELRASSPEVAAALDGKLRDQIVKTTDTRALAIMADAVGNSMAVWVPEAIKPLRQHEDARVRAKAAFALRGVHTEASQQLLFDFWDDQAPQVRLMAYRAAAQHGPLPEEQLQTLVDRVQAHEIQRAAFLPLVDISRQAPLDFRKRMLASILSSRHTDAKLRASVREELLALN